MLKGENSYPTNSHSREDRQKVSKRKHFYSYFTKRAQGGKSPVGMIQKEYNNMRSCKD